MADSHSFLNGSPARPQAWIPGSPMPTSFAWWRGHAASGGARSVGRVGLGVLLARGRDSGGLRATAPTPEPIVAVSSAPSLLRLHDGSTATPLDAASVLAVREDSPGRVALALDRGRARFEVAPRLVVFSSADGRGDGDRGRHGLHRRPRG